MAEKHARRLGGARAAAASADTAGFEAGERGLRRAVVVGDRGFGEPLESMQGSAPADPLVAEMLGKIFDPKAWFSGTDDLDEALQQMAEGPRLSDLWNIERKFACRVQRLGGAAPAHAREQHA